MLSAQDDGTATPILPGELAVGSYKAALAACKEPKARCAVMNCAGQKLHDFLPATRKEFDRLRAETPPRLLDLEWEDTEDFTIQWAEVAAALAWARAQVARGLTLLVNCAQGKSRSGTMATAYVMAKLKLPLGEALARVQARRPLVQPNRAFLAALRRFEPELLSQPAPASREEARLRAGFRVYDADRSGGLSVHELRVALTRSGEPANAAKPMLDEFAAAAGRGDELTEDEFVRAWTEGGHGPIQLDDALLHVK